MKKSEWIRGICFLLLLALVFQILTIVFTPKWYGTWQSTRIVDGFYQMDRDTVDVALLGSSQTIMGLSAMELYRQYGISAYGCGTEEQPLYATYYWLREILRYQSPSVAVLDINELIHASSEAAYRKAFDYMRWSEVKWEAVSAHCAEDEELSLLGYVFPLVEYHSRWDELQGEDISYLCSDKADPCLGFVVPAGTCEIDYKGIPPRPDKEADPPDPEAYEYLAKIAGLCREEGIELLLVKTPRAGWNAAKHNLAAQAAEAFGVPFLDFNDVEIMETMEFDYPMDARDGSHLNIYGAEKVGAYLGNYLANHYDLPDRRKDTGYAYLKEMLAVYERRVEEARINSCTVFSDWLDCLESRYTVILAADGPEECRRLPEDIWKILENTGAVAELADSKAAYGAVWRLENGDKLSGRSDAGEVEKGRAESLQGSLPAWQAGEEITDFEGLLEDGTAYRIRVSGAEEDGMPCSICLNGREWAVDRKGIHLVVYDPLEGKVVDSVWVDTATAELRLGR